MTRWTTPEHAMAGMQRSMDDHHRQDMRRDSQLARAIKALADLVPGTSGHARLTLEDALATLQEERAMIVRRWD